MEKFKKYDVYIYILIAYLFSIAMRYIYITQVGDNPNYMWNNEIMINTNDGYFFATAVKHLLFDSNPYNPLIPVAIDTYTGTIYSVYFLAKILPFSLDTIALYMPAFISSLIVIPIILIMRLFNLTFVGFLAALLASITWSFYNRTMIGYFDTDMYALVFPVFILYFFFRFLKFDTLKDILIASIITSIYVVFYPQGYAAITAIFLTFIAYGFIFIKDKKNFYLAISLIAISLVKVILAIKLAIIIGLYLLYKFKKDLFKKEENYLYIAIFSFLIFIIGSNGYLLILSKLKWYTRTGTVEDSLGLHFYDVAQTIREAGKIPFETFANRISGSVVGFLLAVIGYVLLVIRKKEFLLFLPLVVIGFFAYKGGLRFTVYAIPAMAIGIMYLFWEAVKLLENKKIEYLLLSALAALVIYPNIKHLINYGKYSRPVFSKVEVKDIDKLKKISNPKDYVLTWWDYGYPIWYYGNINTLIDGGKHHNDNYIISKIMQDSSPELMANLSRLAIEKYVQAIKSYKNYLANGKDEKDIPNEFKLYDKDKKPYHAVGDGYGPIADSLFKNRDKKYDEPEDFIQSLRESNYTLPKKSRDIYIYMPNRMTDVFNAVLLFGNLDLSTGKELRDTMFYSAYARSNKNGKILLSNNLLFDSNKGVVYFGSRAIKVRYFVATENAKNGDIKVYPKLYHKDGSLAVVYMKSYGKFIVMDIQTFASNYVQMGLLGNYNKDLFELVIKSPYSRIYKLKR